MKRIESLKASEESSENDDDDDDKYEPPITSTPPPPDDDTDAPRKQELKKEKASNAIPDWLQEENRDKYGNTIRDDDHDNDDYEDGKDSSSKASNDDEVYFKKTKKEPPYDTPAWLDEEQQGRDNGSSSNYGVTDEDTTARATKKPSYDMPDWPEEEQKGSNSGDDNYSTTDDTTSYDAAVDDNDFDDNSIIKDWLQNEQIGGDTNFQEGNNSSISNDEKAWQKMVREELSMKSNKSKASTAEDNISSYSRKKKTSFEMPNWLDEEQGGGDSYRTTDNNDMKSENGDPLENDYNDANTGEDKKGYDDNENDRKYPEAKSKDTFKDGAWESSMTEEDLTKSLDVEGGKSVSWRKKKDTGSSYPTPDWLKEEKDGDTFIGETLEVDDDTGYDGIKDDVKENDFGTTQAVRDWLQNEEEKFDDSVTVFQSTSSSRNKKKSSHTTPDWLQNESKSDIKSDDAAADAVAQGDGDNKDNLIDNNDDADSILDNDEKETDYDYDDDIADESKHDSSKEEQDAWIRSMESQLGSITSPDDDIDVGNDEQENREKLLAIEASKNGGNKINNDKDGTATNDDILEDAAAESSFVENLEEEFDNSDYNNDDEWKDLLQEKIEKIRVGKMDDEAAPIDFAPQDNDELQSLVDPPSTIDSKPENTVAMLSNERSAYLPRWVKTVDENNLKQQQQQLIQRTSFMKKRNTIAFLPQYAIASVVTKPNSDDTITPEELEEGQAFLSFQEKKKAMLKSGIDFTLEEVNTLLTQDPTFQYRVQNEPDTKFGAIFSLEGLLVDMAEFQMEVWNTVALENDYTPPLMDYVRESQPFNARKVIEDIFRWEYGVVEIRNLTLCYHAAAKELFGSIVESTTATSQQRPHDERTTASGTETDSDTTLTSLPDIANNTSGPEKSLHEKYFPLVEGARKWLDTLKNINMPCSVISHLDRSTLDSLLTITGLSDYFADDMRISATDEYDDERQKYLGAALRMERRPDHCMVFDVSPSFSLAVHEMEMRAIAMMGLYHKYELTTADVTMPGFDEMTVMNIRQLFSDVTYEVDEERVRKKPRSYRPVMAKQESHWD